jgi:nicotinamidase-related amidase
MAVTTLDAQTALVVIDLQRGTLANPFFGSFAEVTAHAAELARAFRSADLPVVLVNFLPDRPSGRAEVGRPFVAPPAEFAALVPELGAEETDAVVTKTGWGAFAGTELHALLTDLGVTQVVLAGVATSFGVESTARQAHELGYNVTLAVDAMTDIRLEAHENSVSRIFPILGETGSTRDIVALLERR